NHFCLNPPAGGGPLSGIPRGRSIFGFQRCWSDYRRICVHTNNGTAPLAWPSRKKAFAISTKYNTQALSLYVLPVRTSLGRKIGISVYMFFIEKFISHYITYTNIRIISYTLVFITHR